MVIISDCRLKTLQKFNYVVSSEWWSVFYVTVTLSLDTQIQIPIKSGARHAQHTSKQKKNILLWDLSEIFHILIFLKLRLFLIFESALSSYSPR